MKSVDVKIYDEEYFLTNNAGWERYKNLFNGSPKDIKLKFIKGLYPRLQFVFNLAKIKEEARVLDIGCGRGELVIASAFKGGKAIGIDYSESAIKIAKGSLKRIPNNIAQNITFLNKKIEDIEFEENSFDVIFLTEVIEHLYPKELEILFSKIYKWLKKEDGRFILHTGPNRISYTIMHKYYFRYIHMLLNLIIEPIFKKKLDTRKEQLTEKELRYHVNIQTLHSLKNLLKKARFRFKVWAGEYFTNRDLFSKIYLIIVRLYPLSRVFPLNTIFCNNLFGIAYKKECIKSNGVKTS